ncbi:hypothetical protein PO883_17020 [Massilia sp. DJPM01]|uniref:hypothetical protein n=1 Tax=Massilia sp. DJPM01 TaxID=3024404 RepID=UPI00259FC8F4|nr:hypothetical protein [Massilia sp. DJPM01]MDM5178906.1 hypothetical protein [Massilia sp. DJPM01]
MEVLDKKLLSQLVGGLEVDGGGAGDGSGGGVVAPPEPGQSSVWDIGMVGVEGGREAVVEIHGVSLVFEAPPPPVHIAEPWEGGQFLGQWVEAEPLSYEHVALDGFLIGRTGTLAGTATAAFVTAALEGMGVGSTAGPWGAAAGLVVGGFVGLGTYYLLQRDHPTGHFTGPAGGKVPQMVPIAGPAANETHVATFTGTTHGQVAQMVA